MITRVALNGAAGRMGQLLLRALLDSNEFQLVAAMEHPSHPLLQRDLGTVLRSEPYGLPLLPLEAGVAQQADVILDFSLPKGTAAVLELYREHPLVVGTTGFGPELDAALDAHGARAPLVVAPNFATGVAVLAELVAHAATFLPDYDVEIVETHHRRKQDAPSGTALRLAQVAAAARHQSLEQQACYGRHGHTGQRPEGEIGIHAVRAGDVVGQHEVILAGAGERLVLGHMASSRDAFVQGALRAARWLRGKPRGRYKITDVLGILRQLPTDGVAGA